MAQQDVDNYYDRSRHYYQNYEDMRKNRINIDDLNERNVFISRLKASGNGSKPD